jgi:hypothetical protein
MREDDDNECVIKTSTQEKKHRTKKASLIIMM